MIRIVFLGTSASLPTKEHFTSCFAVKYGKTMMFDACEGAQIQLMKYGVGFASVDAIFISHLHADHFLGLFGLIQSMNFSTRASLLQIYGPKGSKAFFERIFSIHQLAPNFPVEFLEVEPSAKPFYSSDLFTVRAFKANHGTEALGFVLEGKPTRRFDKEKCDKLGVHGRMFSDLEAGKIVELGKKKVKYADVTYVSPGKKIVYSGDTAPNLALSAACKNADIAVLDSTFAKEDVSHAKEKRHSTCVQAATIAAKAKAKRLVLTHFSNRYDKRDAILEQAKEKFAASELAQEGLEILL